MNWAADGIAIAGRREAMDQQQLQREGVEAVLQLYGPDPDPLRFPLVAAVLDLYLLDGEPLPPALLRQGVDFIRQQRELGRAVLVTCGLGVSRSPTFVAAYLHEQGQDLPAAFLMIQHQHPRTLPHPALLRSLVESYQLTTSPEALLVTLVKARKR